jgi:hypothetical protein
VLVEFEHDGKDRVVAFFVKIVWLQDSYDVWKDIFINKDSTEDGLLGVDVLWWDSTFVAIR